MDDIQKRAREALSRHPAADYILDRLIYAIHPLIDQIEDLEEKLEGSRESNEPVGKIKKEQMIDALKKSSKILTVKKVKKIILKTTDKEVFDAVDKEDYPKLLSAIDKAVIKHQRKNS